MPIEIVLIRHGQSEGNRDRKFAGHSQSGLTDLGHKQAALTAKAVLTRLPSIDRIITSDLIRAIDTATPLSIATAIPLTPQVAVRERDMGAFSGLTFDQVKERYPEGWSALLNRDPDYVPPGGESHRQCSERVARFLAELTAAHTTGRFVIYSHAVAISHMLRHIISAPVMANPPFFFDIDNCSLHHIHRLDDGVYRVAAINDTAHLRGIEPRKSVFVDSLSRRNGPDGNGGDDGGIGERGKDNRPVREPAGQWERKEKR